MFRVMKFATPVVAFALLFTLTNLRASAADTATTDKGTISGTVVDKDGKPVADAHVRLFHPMEHAKKKNKDNAENQAALGNHKAREFAKGDKKGRPTPVAETTTDNDGKFTLSDVEPGDYTIVANLKGSGTAHQKVTVEAGKTETVSLTLAARGAGHGDHQAKPDQQ
jgi:protocatechuate 3,4-dioxygenase beta subunit